MDIYQEIWNKTLNDLKNEFEESSFNDIFYNLDKVYKFQNGYIYLIAPTEFHKNRINTYYINKVNQLVEKHSKEKMQIKLITKEEIVQKVEKEYEDFGYYRDGNINKSFTFDNFVVGESNRFPFTMALKVADQPGILANPFYIFGSVGLGKTHLMQAIGNYILDQDVNKKVLYVKADSFIEDYTSLLKREKIDLFNEKYRNLDVLLIDDIQILGGAKKSQLEFFKLFDILKDNNKQIVITSDKPASELVDIMDRLTSRFQSGLTVNIKIPDLKHRIDILKKKLSLQNQIKEEQFPNEVICFLAETFEKNVRELEGALKNVLFYCVSSGVEVNIENAKKALENILNTKSRTKQLDDNQYDKLQSVVSSFYNIPLSEMIGKKRNAKYTLPRHIAMYLLKNLYNLTYKEIGSLFSNRDHSTVLAACEKIDNELKVDENLRLAIESIKRKVNKI